VSNPPCKVWTYWEGPMPDWIGWCLETLRRTCGKRLVILTPENIDRYLPERVLHRRWKDIEPIACKCGALRVAIIQQHGGWWFDADTIGIKAPPPSLGKKFVCCRWDKDPLRIVNGYFGSQKNQRIVNVWLAGINRILESVERFDEMLRAPWGVLGSQILTPIVMNRDHRPLCNIVSRKIWLPLDVDAEPWRFCNPGRVVDYLEPSTMCFGLNQSWILHKCAGLLAADPEWRRNSPLLIHDIMRELERRATE